MIRHACVACSLAPPLPILTLPVPMIESSLGALLVPTIGTSSLAEPGLMAAGQAAIALPTVTVRAEKEYGAAFVTQANPQPEHRFAVNRHAPSQAALDNGNNFVAT
jgi:hypothetical protein